MGENSERNSQNVKSILLGAPKRTSHFSHATARKFIISLCFVISKRLTLTYKCGWIVFLSLTCQTLVDKVLNEES